MIATATLLATAAVVSIVAAGVSAYGMYQQGQAQKKMSDYNAELQDYNQQSAKNSAVAHTQQAQYESTLIEQRNNRLRGAQAAAASSSGLDMSGSVTDVMYDSSLQGELDSLSAIYKGQATATADRGGAITAGVNANMSRMSGNQAVANSYYGASGSLLSGAGTAVGYWGMRRSPYQDSTEFQPTFVG